MSWFSRAFFIVVALVAVAGLSSTVGCTRRGNNSPAPPTAMPQTTFYVNPKTGSDATGKGTSTAPYRSITKALSVVKKSTLGGLTIQLAIGAYTTSSGEVFPIVIPTGVTIAGINTSNRNPASGSFVAGYGEDTNLEKLLNAPAKTYFTTMEAPPGVSAVLDGVYIGVRAMKLVAPQKYASFDALGTLSASHVSFGAGLPQKRIYGGIIVPSGTLSCSACIVNGNRYAIAAFTVPGASSAPSVTLSGQISQSVVGGLDTGILTDGSATVNVANQTFQSMKYAYQDTLAAPTTYPSTAPTGSPTTSPYPSGSPTSGPYGSGTVDFGSPAGSVGGNVFIGATVSEISVTAANVTITAYGNTWNPNKQFANSSGQYPANRLFGVGPHGAHGQNVTVLAGIGSVVKVGPLLSPTPTPSPPPSTSPSPSPSPT